jgi:hypothetical protein
VNYGSAGPEFAASPPPEQGQALVYVYRPAESFGAAWAFMPVVGNREFTLWAGHYGAFLVPEGQALLRGYTQRLPLGFGQNPSVPVATRNDTPAFVRVRYKENRNSFIVWQVEVVDAATAQREIADLRLGAGGRPRYPNPPTPGDTPWITGLPRDP